MAQTRKGEKRVPIEERTGHDPGLSIDDLDSDAVLDITEAAKRVNMARFTLMDAIRKGELEAFVPRGKDPRRTGVGHGYRVTKAELERWYFGKPKAKPKAKP